MGRSIFKLFASKVKLEIPLPVQEREFLGKLPQYQRGNVVTQKGRPTFLHEIIQLVKIGRPVVIGRDSKENQEY
jgi:hypothetical protein